MNKQYIEHAVSPLHDTYTHTHTHKGLKGAHGMPQACVHVADHMRVTDEPIACRTRPVQARQSRIGQGPAVYLDMLGLTEATRDASGLRTV